VLSTLAFLTVKRSQLLMYEIVPLSWGCNLQLLQESCCETFGFMDVEPAFAPEMTATHDYLGCYCEQRPAPPIFYVSDLFF